MTKQERELRDKNLQEDLLDGNLFKRVIKRIDKAVKDNVGLTDNKLCRLAGVNPSTLKRAKDGKNVTRFQIEKIEAYIVKHKL